MNTNILDGDALGIYPNTAVGEVFDKCAEVFGSRRVIYFMHSIQIQCGDRLLWLKDRTQGRCDFPRN